ncbi:accessory gene regulator B [Clostridium algifaecis]|uniref:Accessory gene regulator B n=1 Tax=Clostridium algifaecis TaxID=1472040 RepID=A0ABS4KU12_9CLOT|nr:accessory gene regulator B family protein [Clostridium algifaecis]MBP2033522.1 accessory gene regulator B [Clostridium algifaecis]
MSLIERLSNRIGFKITSTLNLDNDEKDIVSYGAFCVLQKIVSIFWVLLFGFIFKVLIEAIIVLFTIASLRKYSGGVHATSPARCIIIGTSVCIALSLLIKKIFINFNIELIVTLGILIFIICFYLIYKLAPADTESKPIVDKSMIIRLKRSSVLFIFIILIIDFICLILYFNTYNILFLNIIVCTCAGVMWQSFTLTNMAYKFISRIDLMIKKLFFVK